MDKETTICPFCGTTQKVAHVLDERVITRHSDGDKPCLGWGIKVAKAAEVTAAIYELLDVIAKKIQAEWTQS